MSRTFWMALVCFSLLGCGDDEANEARLLLDRLDGLDVPELDVRRRRVDALSNMPVESERVRAVRDECVPMHDALLRADEATAEARAVIEALERGEDVAGSDAADALERSEEAVSEVGEHRANCERELAELRTRYGARRGG